MAAIDTPLRGILHSYGVAPDDDSIPDCIAEIVAIIDAHIPSVTDDMDRGEGEWADLDGPRDDIGDYIGDQRECRCGRHIDGFYDYVDHLKEVLS